MRKQAIFVVMVLAATNIISAETFIVDPNGFYDFDNIQDAINYSWDGDTVIVRPGTYDGSIYFNGRAITLTSIDPDDPAIVESTILTQTASPIIIFNFAENLDSVVTGFTIDNGGIVCYLGATPTITKNIISPGTANGISSAGGDISNNIISGSSGYGIKTRENCTISNNTIVGNQGYGISIELGTVIVKNNIIAYNAGGLERTRPADSECQNSFNCFWGNSFGGSAAPGYGDIYVDPYFVSEGWWNSGTWRDGDYHLKSEAGRCDPDGETWIIDDITSRCIDGGDPNDFIGIEPNSNGGIINIGVYGGTAQASKSTSGVIEPICPASPAADLNNDCKVNLDDSAIMASEWLIDNTE